MKKKILFVASECAPFIKTGGLADVAYSLPKSLKKEDVDIRVIIPKYFQIPESFRYNMKHVGYKNIKLSWRDEYLGIEEYSLDNITYYFVDNEKYFKRRNLYGEGDDCERFAFFSKAVIECFDIINFVPDIIHCNDWHTGVVPLYLNEEKLQGRYKNIKTVFTIHNLRFQGNFPATQLEWVLGLSPKTYFKEEACKFHDQISFMKGAVNYSDIITTVSESYCEEIMTPYFGEQLDGLFRHHAHKLYGIVNGIDYDSFNPEKDTDIKKNFSSRDITGKSENKKFLQKELGLEVNSDIPLLSIITRLDRQKGLDLITCVFDQLINETNYQFVLLGNGEPDYELFFSQKSKQYPGRVSTHIGFNNILAKEIYAGSDMFLMPSQFEPCGLSQLISMRYGTVPVVRETGGLKDTVVPYNEYDHSGNGFSFTNYNAHDMLHILKYAAHIYSNKKTWTSLVKHNMTIDNSWTHSAKKYLELYNKLQNN